MNVTDLDLMPSW